MKTLETFLSEVEDLPHATRAKYATGGMGKSLGAKSSASVKRNKLKHLSTMKNGAKVYHRSNGNEHEYHVKHPTEDHHSLIVITKKSGKSEDIKNAAATKTNPTKLHHFYHHMITHHDKILTTKQQTGGSQKSWEKLAKMKGVGIHGWHRGKPVNTDHKFKDRSDSHLSTQEYNKDVRNINKDHAKGVAKAKDVDKHQQGLDHVQGIKMVAHKK